MSLLFFEKASVDVIAESQSNQQVREEELDLQPSRGPRDESLVNTFEQFLDDNYEDVLRTSNIQKNFSLSASDRNLTGRPVLPLGWIVPDGTNRTLEEIKDRKISNDRSPGGGQAGAVVLSLHRLEPYYRTQFFLVDLETGEMFAYIRQQWRRAGIYCSNKPFVVNDLLSKVEQHGQVMWAELEAEQQTPLVDIRRSPRHFKVPPPLPAMVFSTFGVSSSSVRNCSSRPSSSTNTIGGTPDAPVAFISIGSVAVAVSGVGFTVLLTSRMASA